MFDFFKVKRPLFICALLGCITIIFTFENRFLAPLILCAFLFASILLFYKGKLKIAFAAILLIAVMLSGVKEFAEIDRVNRISGEVQRLTVAVTENAAYTNSIATAEVALKSGGTMEKGTHLRMTFDADIRFDVGDIIEAEFKIDSFEDSDFKMNFYANDILADIYLESSPSLIGTDMRFDFLNKVRNHIKNTLYSELSMNTASTLNAIMLGDKSALSDEIYAAVKTTGVSHVMAVSGLHLSIIMGMVMRLLDRFIHNKYLRVAVSLCALLFIVAICGFTRSVMRSALMFALAFLAPLTGRRADSFNSLCAAVVILLISSPLVIYDIGFELSVLATFAVIVPAPYFTDAIIMRLKKPNAFKEWLIGAVLTSLFACIITLPISVYNFGYVSVIAVVTNLLITYAVTGALMLSVIGVATSAVTFISKPVLLAASYCAEYINAVLLNLSRLPFAGVPLESNDLKSAVSLAAFGVTALLFSLMYTCKYRKNVIELNSRIFKKGG